MRPLLRLLVLLTLCLAGPEVLAREPTLFPAPSASEAAPAATLVIYSTADTPLIAPVIEAFQAEYDAIAVAYHDLQSVEIFERVRDETDAGGQTADFVFSSAIGLQFKLANDGYARRLDMPTANYLPPWASWRDTLFGLTFEPATIIYNKPFFAAEGLTPPATRAELAALLDARQDLFHGRIATYDVERSGVGFQFLAWDVRQSDDIWRLVALMGRAGVKLYSNSAAMIDRVAQGRFVLGYNILGSYARAMAAGGPDIGIVQPRDYTVVLSRLGLVPRAARLPDLGRAFLDFLLSEKGQRAVAAAGLGTLHPDVDAATAGHDPAGRLDRRFRPIPVGSGLLAFLDQAKRRQIIRRWNQTLLHP
ncbi:ABC transporter substrate-binding protein [Caenispirillum salinarum]|uniref:ABC transporter substrate-binding protein n=1 Tax=Caenispirillum salinarum TaxID=859058 RepID=UPI00384EBDDA